MGACISNQTSKDPTDGAKQMRTASQDFGGLESTKSKPSSSPVVTPAPLAEKHERGSLSSMGRLSINRHLTLPPINIPLPSPSSCTKTLGQKPLLHALSPTQSHDGAQPPSPGTRVEVTVNTNAAARRNSLSVINPMSPSAGSRAKRPPTPTLRLQSIIPASPKRQGPTSPQGNPSGDAELQERRARHLRGSSLPEMQLQDLKAFQFPGGQSPASPKRSPMSPHSQLKRSSSDEEHATQSQAQEPLSPTGGMGPALLSRRKSLASLQLKPFDGMLDSVKVKGKGRVGRRASECTGLESMKTFQAVTSASLTPAHSSLFGGGGKSPPLASIFDEYAVGAERMKYRHVLHLCHDLIDAFIEGYRQRVERELKEKNGEATAKNVETQMATDLPYMLGEGVHKDKGKWVEIAARRMWKLLDFNDEGFVSKTKFMAKFMKACEEVLNVSQLKKLNGTQETTNKEPCMVM